MVQLKSQHQYQLCDWWDLTKYGDVVQTLWVCVMCGDTQLHVTPDQWRTPCPGSPPGDSDRGE